MALKNKYVFQSHSAPNPFFTIFVWTQDGVFILLFARPSNSVLLEHNLDYVGKHVPTIECKAIYAMTSVLYWK